MTDLSIDELRAALNLSEEAVPNLDALASAVARGLNVRSADQLVRLGIPKDELHRFIPRRTLERRRRDGVLLTPRESERIERLAAAFALSWKVFGDSTGLLIYFFLRS